VKDEAAPLILTLKLDADSFARFDALRRAHFPTERNHLRAHLTLFHQLPGDRREDVLSALTAAAAVAPFPLSFPGVRSLGRGVAAEVVAPELTRLRAELATRFRANLTPQDAQGFRPHVTLQNKVEPAEARELKARLEAGWAPWEGRGEGLLLHRYLGGPWALEAELPFRGGS
jgi:2'-5' RNA ligase